MHILKGDSKELLKSLKENSIDAVVCDPPYELGFMGKSWDNKGIAYDIELWAECLRVLKPGGHLLAFSGTRTYHRMACAIEDAGFEVRDMIEWVYGSGFPKSHNIGVAVDKLQGNEREETDYIAPDGKKRWGGNSFSVGEEPDGRGINKATKGTSEWEGWGTALKPAHEPICMARKPLSEKTVAENVLKYGTGGINIDESRVDGKTEIHSNGKRSMYGGNSLLESKTHNDKTGVKDYGRFPANLIHDNSEEVRECFPDNIKGEIGRAGRKSGGNYEASSYKVGVVTATGFKDNGNASRFFKSIIYQAKSPKSERLIYRFNCVKLNIWTKQKKTKQEEENTVQEVSLVRAILDLVAPNLSIGGYGWKQTDAYPTDFISTIRTAISKITALKTWNLLMQQPTKESIQDVLKKVMDGINYAEFVVSEQELIKRIGIFQDRATHSTEDVKNATRKSLLKIRKPDAWQDAYSNHPTHKPIALMEYLINMVSKKGQTILDPFCGSGSTGVACVNLDRDFIGMDMEEDYIKIAEARIKKAQDLNKSKQQKLL